MKRFFALPLLALLAAPVRSEDPKPAPPVVVVARDPGTRRVLGAARLEFKDLARNKK